MDTVLGEITIDLFDAVTPATVANFLNYVTDGDYDNSIVHRSIPGFFIQGGGYDDSLALLPTDPPVGVSELAFSNVRGTIAMANIGSSPPTARSQWFINLADNLFLDTGFVVFGEVRPADMAVVDAIAALPTVNGGVGLETLPVLDDGQPTVPSNLVVVNSTMIVPEPSTVALLMPTVYGLFFFKRNRSRRSR